MATQTFFQKRAKINERSSLPGAFTAGLCFDASQIQCMMCPTLILIHCPQDRHASHPKLLKLKSQTISETASPSCVWAIFVRCSISCSVFAYQGKTWQVWSSYFRVFYLQKAEAWDLRENFVRIDIGSAAAFPSLGGPSVPCLHIVSKSEIMSIENNYTIRSFRKLHLFFYLSFWNRKSQTLQIGVQTSKPLWHGPDLMNFLNFMNVSQWFSHVFSCFVLFYLQKPSNLHKAQGFSAYHGLCCSQEAWQAITGVTCFGCQPQFWSWVTWPFWPAMWKEIARVTEISIWGPVPKDLAVQDMIIVQNFFNTAFLCSFSLWWT